MRRILAGIDCEYGILVSGNSAEDQIDDSQALVESISNEGFFVDRRVYAGWDYRFENPRNDLRGFQLKHLQVAPTDAQFDVGRNQRSSIEIRADRVLWNGARFYNDHGHPEYSTPESFSIFEAALLDAEGESLVNRAAAQFEHEVTLYKNNTDYHGASYGTHESYLVPRQIGFEDLYRALIPILLCRQILTGAGKVGSENGEWCDFQLSQRADFFVEAANAETLWRRPVFNTRDEPHADPAQWIRLHVISGDANMNPISTALKLGLVKLGLWLLDADEVPDWKIAHPVQAFKAISRDMSLEFRIDLGRKNWTTAYDVLESYFAAAEQTLGELNDEAKWTIDTGRALMASLRGDGMLARRSIDWATKRHLFEQLIEEEDLTWRSPTLQAYDLEYSNIDPQQGLFHALQEMGEIEVPSFPTSSFEATRAFARGLAVQKFGEKIRNIGWRGITFGDEFIELRPDVSYPDSLSDIPDVETFIQSLKDIHASI